MEIKKTTRKKWMELLATASLKDLKTAQKNLNAEIDYEYIVKPETGMLMVQARADGSHSRFHLGEMSVSKCVLKVQEQYIGYAMTAGSDPAHSELAALFDGLLQTPEYHDVIKTNLINKLAEKQIKKDIKLEQEVAETRVEFFTLKRGE
ncbi:phosphonate C-P lyase system protein PhnG [Desulfobacula toluolica]|uniref:PhnG: phopsphonate metabolism protein, predicted C-P lyase subunit n=1 Tax=Desulfobacula toluolica (strain DSM 7467 / Tol2) TaxID=651182 RepID=K0NQY3_DESTT|nr:phosphonate C-P lyase system protein PhnG [Desulfobacula toluolica]CCK81347.1 PhnG: phopsphonate metabolism protein, predicted C-P lyase subunit [Desulfobacula toluolica Tol2]